MSAIYIKNSQILNVCTFWIICFIKQRTLYNHELSVVVGVLHRWCHLCTPPPATGLDIET